MDVHKFYDLPTIVKIHASKSIFFKYSTFINILHS